MDEIEREEAEEAAAWAMRRSAHLHEVYAAAKRLVGDLHDNGETYRELRSALRAADTAVWHMERPSHVMDMLAWLRRWPGKDGREMYSWVEGNLGIATDGYAILAVRGVRIDEYKRAFDRSDGTGPVTAIIAQEVDWTKCRLVTQADLTAAMSQAMGAEAKALRIGPAGLDPQGRVYIDPELVNRFVPRLDPAAKIRVHFGGPYTPVAFRAHSADPSAWTAIIMPQRATEKVCEAAVPLVLEEPMTLNVFRW